MSDITISVIQPPSTTINVGVDETTLIQAGMGLPPHSVTHISGGSDEINHNLLAGLQGGSGGQYYHLSSGQYFNLITGVDLSPYATITYVTGISGQLQAQITVLNNQTGSYVLNSQTGQFYSSSNPSGYTATGYVTGVSGNLQTQITTLNNQTGSYYPRTNPSGFITGINNIVYTTGDQIISGAKTFTGSFNVSTNDAIIIRSTGYTNGVEIGGGYFNKIADGGFVNDFGVGGTENHFGDSATSSNSFGGSAVQNDFGAYATLNNYYGGSVIGELIFDTAPTFSSGEVRDSFIISSLGASENEDPTSLVLRSSLGYSVFSSVISRVGSDSANYNHNKITQTIDGEPTVLYDYYFPQVNGTLALDSTAVMLQGNQIVNGVKNFTSIPTVNNTGILLSGSSYITGISGGLQNQITTLNNQTGSFYPRSNPSGFITGVDLSFSGNYYTKIESEDRYVNTTGTEIILGDKTFSDKVYINNLYVTGLETIVNTTNTNVASNYLLLNLTGGIVDGGIFFVTGSGLTGINDSGAIIGFDHSDEFKFGIGTRASDLSTLNTIASFGDVTGASGILQTQINILNSATGSYILDSETGQFYPNSNPSGFITGINNLVFTTGNQTISGAKTFSNNLVIGGNDLFVNTSTDRVGILTATPTATLDVNGSGLFRSGLNVNGTLSVNNSYFDGALWQANTLDGYVAIADFDAINYIEVGDLGVTLEASTKSFQVYAPTRMHYALTGTTGRFTSIVEAPNLVYNTGNQTIGGAKTFSNNLTVNGGDLFVNTSNNRVGVNTITPTATLDVNGTALFRSGLNISGARPTVNSTGILLSGEATTQTYVTGISGSLQTQITTLNNQTGSYYPRTNPSGYITGVDLSFSGNYYTKDESESRYVNTTGAETILGNKTFHDNVYINNLYVTGLETIVNTTNTNVASNYIMLNLTGGSVDGGIFFVTGSGLTGINDSGAIIGFDHSDEFKFGISTRASDLSTLNTIASVEQMTGISGGLQTQISTLNNQTGSYVLNTQTGNFITTNQTGDFYANSNPSGFITGINDLVYTTGDQSISGNINISGNLTISGVYNIYQQIENAKILSIAYAIAL
jgi:hypothetical protein